jgi:hypothetical protein
MSSGTPLSMEDIGALLAPKDKTAQVQAPHARPMQAGLLNWMNEFERCASRGCGSPTFIRVLGVPYCTSHALNFINQEYMKLDGTYERLNIDSCSCNAGRHSYNNIHTEDCPVFTSIKEERDNSTN